MILQKRNRLVHLTIDFTLLLFAPEVFHYMYPYAAAVCLAYLQRTRVAMHRRGQVYELHLFRVVFSAQIGCFRNTRLE